MCFIGGDPFFYDTVILLFYYLQCRSCQFLTVRYVLLADLHGHWAFFHNRILYKIDIVPRCVLCLWKVCFNCTIGIHRNLNVCCNLAIAFRCDCLAKDIGLACLQLLAEVMRLALLRCPAVNHLLRAVF